MQYATKSTGMKKDIGWATTKETRKYQGIQKYQNTVMIYVKKKGQSPHWHIYIPTTVLMKVSEIGMSKIADWLYTQQNNHNFTDNAFKLIFGNK